MSNIQLYLGDSKLVLKKIEDNSIDACITDPPYGLTSIVKRFGKEGSAPAQHGKDGSFARLSGGFMGKIWDGSGIEYDVDFWKEVLRVLKPGGHLLSFGGSRTYHRMTCAIEDAGFEIRDMIEWVYGSGFPKSLNIGKAIDKLQGNKRNVIGKGTSGEPKTHTSSLNMSQVKNNTFSGEFDITKGNSEWEGWGTALKPAHEPIVLARKPLSEKTIIENVLKWGVGGLAIDNCRVYVNPKVDDIKREVYRGKRNKSTDWGSNSGFKNETNKFTGVPLEGRFPANFIHDGSDEVVKLFPNTTSGARSSKYIIGNEKGEMFNHGIYGKYKSKSYKDAPIDSGSASRFFYCAKASKSERDIGCDNLEEKESIYPGANSFDEDGNRLRENGSIIPPLKSRNNHPTVKPIALMKYLITLISREGQIVLDPFIGSGSTGVGCKLLNRKFIGIEQSEEYIKIAQARIKGT
jgi:site-specific DNA-methyltransferase (adenine-specific)